MSRVNVIVTYPRQRFLVGESVFAEVILLDSQTGTYLYLLKLLLLLLTIFLGKTIGLADTWNLEMRVWVYFYVVHMCPSCVKTKLITPISTTQPQQYQRLISQTAKQQIQSHAKLIQKLNLYMDLMSLLPQVDLYPIIMSFIKNNTFLIFFLIFLFSSPLPPPPPPFPPPSLTLHRDIQSPNYF